MRLQTVARSPPLRLCTRLLLLSIVLNLAVASLDTISARRWRLRMRDFVVQNGAILRAKTASTVECGFLCWQHPGCLSFFHGPEDCLLHKEIFLEGDNSPKVPLPGARYMADENVTSCGYPPKLINANMVFGGTLPGNQTVYQCHTGYVFSGRRSWSRCTSRGAWRGPNGVCTTLRPQVGSSSVDSMADSLPRPDT